MIIVVGLWGFADSKIYKVDGKCAVYTQVSWFLYKDQREQKVNQIGQFPFHRGGSDKVWEGDTLSNAPRGINNLAVTGAHT